MSEQAPSTPTIVQQAEVINAAIQGIPPTSELGKYFAEPATELVDDGHGRSVVRDAEYTNYDAASKTMAEALEAFAEGKVSRVNLMHGMVNAYFDAHKGLGNKNLRAAFESLAEFGITGSADFHQMFNPAGKTVGVLRGGAEVSDDDAFAFAEGAVAIRDGQRQVMFHNSQDQPNMKMYGMIDPITGDVLPNVFMLIQSGTYFDKDGSTSNFSNLASASLVLVPEKGIQDRMVAKEQVSAEAAEAPRPHSVEEEAIDWTKLQDGTFNVRRSNGEVEQGWSIAKIMPGKAGVESAVIRGFDQKLGAVEKTIPLSELLSWQSDPDETKPRH